MRVKARVSVRIGARLGRRIQVGELRPADEGGLVHEQPDRVAREAQAERAARLAARARRRRADMDAARGRRGARRIGAVREGMRLCVGAERVAERAAERRQGEESRHGVANRGDRVANRGDRAQRRQLGQRAEGRQLGQRAQPAERALPPSRRRVGGVDGAGTLEEGLEGEARRAAGDRFGGEADRRVERLVLVVGGLGGVGVRVRVMRAVRGDEMRLEAVCGAVRCLPRSPRKTPTRRRAVSRRRRAPTTAAGARG